MAEQRVRARHEDLQLDLKFMVVTQSRLGGRGENEEDIVQLGNGHESNVPLPTQVVRPPYFDTGVGCSPACVKS